VRTGHAPGDDLAGDSDDQRAAGFPELTQNFRNPQLAQSPLLLGHRFAAVLVPRNYRVLMAATGGAHPARRLVERPSLDGTTYERWKADSIGSRGDGAGWVLSAFNSQAVQRRHDSVHRLLRQRG
jgi:hypothetical protein